jgi:hypothetical protein
MLNEFRIEVAEPGELVLIQVHHEELVRGREIRGLGGKLEREKDPLKRRHSPSSLVNEQ